MMKELSMKTTAQECLIDITHQIRQIVRERAVESGVALLFVPHTTCALTIQENADPGVQHDILLILRRLIPRRDPAYRHIEDNSASHLQASMMGFSQFVFIEQTNLILGRWQAIYLAEFDGPRTRQVFVKILSDYHKS